MSKNGYLYIANRKKFLNESIISAKSLKRFNEEPVCIVCPEELICNEMKQVFDEIIINEEISSYTYLSKVIGLQLTPFDRTVFLDSDTFVTAKISELFDVLDIVDFATTNEVTMHTTNRIELKYKYVFPEFNSGVIVYKSNTIMHKVFTEWFDICKSNNIINDMPGLREAVLKNIDKVTFSVLPDLYNTHGFKSMLMLHSKVKVIHERLGYKWGVITPHFMSFEEMDKFAKRINKIEYKRVYIPKIGLLPYNWSPTKIVLYLKRKMGFKRISKSW